MGGAMAVEDGRKLCGIGGEVDGSDRAPCEGVGSAGEGRSGEGAGVASPHNSLTFFPSATVDLFGEPVPPKRAPGRPRHVPTGESRALVEQLRGEGGEQVEIAAALGVSLPTLRLNYAAELQSKSQTGARRDRRDTRKD